MTQLDLHGLVPDPPDDLLDLEVLEARIHRRRNAIRAAASTCAVIVVAAAVIVGVSLGSSRASRQLTAPTVRQDGAIVFAKNLAGSPRYLPNQALYAYDPSTGATRRITHEKGGIDEVATSPDGRRIAYTQETYGEHNHNPRTRYVTDEYLRIVNTDGSDDHAIYRCPSAACSGLSWSPSSDRLLFAGGAGLHVYGPDGRLVSVCVGRCPGIALEQASWSPDGRRFAIVYAKTITLPGGATSGVGTIAVMNADGSALHQITDLRCSVSDQQDCTDDSDPIWSPDGSEIAFTRTMLPRLLPLGVGGAVGAGPFLVYAVHPDGSDPHQLANCGSDCTIRSLSWSPTGQRLAFVGQPFLIRKPVLLHVIGTRTEVPLSRPVSGLTELFPELAWSPSGTQLVIAGRTSGDKGSTAGVLTIAVDDRSLGSPQQIDRAGYPPVGWLPAHG